MKKKDYGNAVQSLYVLHHSGESILQKKKTNIAGYAESIAGARFYREFLTVIEPQTLALRAKLKEVYGCNLYSLNPFVNFGLEGHEYER